VSETPIDQLLSALDKLDLDAVAALLAPEARLLTVDGRQAHGAEAACALLGSFLATVSSTSHRVTAQWHSDDAWIAELEADYELVDGAQLSGLPRVFVVRQGPAGITALHVYGAHERPLYDRHADERGLWVGGRWIPPL
jgi:hypothetical protein